MDGIISELVDYSFGGQVGVGKVFEFGDQLVIDGRPSRRVTMVLEALVASHLEGSREATLGWLRGLHRLRQAGGTRDSVALGRFSNGGGKHRGKK